MNLNNEVEIFNTIKTEVYQCMCGNPECNISIYINDKSDKFVILPVYYGVSYPITIPTISNLVCKNEDKIKNQTWFNIIDYVANFFDEAFEVLLFPITFLYNIYFFITREVIMYPDVVVSNEDMPIIKEHFPDFVFIIDDDGIETGQINHTYCVSKSNFDWKMKWSIFVNGYIVISLRMFLPYDITDENGRRFSFGELLS